MHGASALIGLWNLFRRNYGSDPNVDDSNAKKPLPLHLLSLTPAVYISDARTVSSPSLFIPPMSASDYPKEKADSPTAHDAGVYAEDTVPDHTLVRQLKCSYPFFFSSSSRH